MQREVTGVENGELGRGEEVCFKGGAKRAGLNRWHNHPGICSSAIYSVGCGLRPLVHKQALCGKTVLWRPNQVSHSFLPGAGTTALRMTKMWLGLLRANQYTTMLPSTAPHWPQGGTRPQGSLVFKTAPNHTATTDSSKADCCSSLTQTNCSMCSNRHLSQSQDTRCTCPSGMPSSPSPPSNSRLSLRNFPRPTSFMRLPSALQPKGNSLSSHTF